MPIIAPVPLKQKMCPTGRWVTDGLKDYGTALLTHFGDWMQPERRQDKGPRPKPRWMPLPQLPGFSANNARVHVPRKARQSLAGVGLQGDAKDRSGR